METKYSFFDKIKYYSLQYRVLVVIVMTISVLGLLGIGISYCFFKNKPYQDDFDEIQVLIDKIEKQDEHIVNKLEVEEITKEVRGIDISSWQGNVDWEKVRASGVEFVMLRVGLRKLVSGEIVEDTTFETNVKGANTVGIPVGVYFYSSAINELEVLEEASFVLNKIKNYKITYPVAYDMEAFGENRLENVSDERINYNALIFLNYFKSHGYQGMLYGNKTALTYHWNLSRFENHKIWLAHYIEKTDYDRGYDMWQFTDQGQIDGISGNLDLNVAYFAYKEVSNGNDF